MSKEEIASVCPKAKNLLSLQLHLDSKTESWVPGPKHG